MKTKMKFRNAIPLALLIFFTTSSCKSLYCNTYSGIPKQIIPVSQAIAMKKEYKSKIAPLIESGNGKGYQATEFAWISLDSLKKYIAFLDKIQEVNKKEISGIRIYFAAYPNNNTFSATGKTIDHPGRETVFLAPTMKVQQTSLSSQYRNLENVPFYIQPAGKDALAGTFTVIEELLYKADNNPPKPVIKSADKTAGDPVPAAQATSVIFDNLGLVPPPKTLTP